MINWNRIVYLDIWVAAWMCTSCWHAVLGDDTLVVTLHGISDSWIVAVACCSLRIISWINILMSSSNHTIIWSSFCWNLFLNKIFILVFGKSNAVPGFTYFPLFILVNVRTHTRNSFLPRIWILMRFPSFSILLLLLSCYVWRAFYGHGFIIIF